MGDFSAFTITEAGEESDPFDIKSERTQNSLLPLKPKILSDPSDRGYLPSSPDEDFVIEPPRTFTSMNPIKKPEIKIIEDNLVVDSPSKQILIENKKPRHLKLIQSIFRLNGLLRKGMTHASV